MGGFVSELAALATAVLLAGSSTFFALSARRVGSTNVNRVRLFIAALFAIALHWMLRGEPLPLGAPSRGWLWLACSGIIGLALGDALLFQAYVLIGPALSMLIFALNPVVAALLGLVFLDERLTGLEWTGIAVTLSGIAWVVSEPKRRAFVGPSRSYASGLLFACGGALGQAVGMITAKKGLLLGVEALSGNLIRLLAATAAMWVASMAAGSALRTSRSFREQPGALGFVAAGAIVGPLLAVSLSLVAIERAPIGIATTLMSLTPIFLLPVARFVFGEPISHRAVLGTLLAISGATLLFH